MGRLAEARGKMADLIFVVLTAAFFAVSWAYVRGCERLAGTDRQ